MPDNAIHEAMLSLQQGNFVIILDDKNRENEADLILAAEKATEEKLNFMLKEAGGIMCIAMAGERLDHLKIPMMVQDSTDRFRTPFTVSVDAKQNATTGVSVHDRLQAIKTLISPESKPEDLLRPGHTFPLRAAKGGLKERQGHTEAAVELCRIAGLYLAAVICEIMNGKGEMAKGEEINAFSKKFKIQIIMLNQLI
ncbi:3,4-dihydroxy-2-butanone-4-phosphate synthase [Candidatus Woesearchaeota archaeon]|nr:3,4-dihydroxy-2-butanone-4-phosphate synthase [Candidatus Woesearchaeota archaeon]